MSDASRYIWLDVTELLRWVGPLTGIQRVTLCLAVHLDKLAAVRFFFSSHGRFFEVPKEVIVPSGPYETNSAKSSGMVSRLKTKLHAVQRVALWLAGRIIHRTLARFFEVLREIRLSRRLGRFRQRAFFGSSDVVLLTGSTWNHKGLLDALAIVKTNNRFKVATLVFDAIPITNPEFFGPGLPRKYAEWLFEAVCLSDSLLAISRSTAREVAAFATRELLALPPVEVIRLGDTLGYTGASVCPDPSLLSQEFILSVGTFEVRKNYTLLWYVGRLAQERNIRLPKLVMVGRVGWLANDLLYLMSRTPGAGDMFLHLPEADDAQLSWLYEHCRFLLYPSMKEGFGLPVAEALARGKVCVASRISSVEEFGGDLVDYFSPNDPAACLAALKPYLDNAALAERELEVRRYHGADWSQTASEVRSALLGQ